MADTAAGLMELQSELEAAILRRAEALRKAGADSTQFKVAVSEVALSIRNGFSSPSEAGGTSTDL